MRKIGAFLILALFPLLVLPTSAITYAPATYSTTDVDVVVQITAPDLITSPFNVNIHANMSIEAAKADISQVNVTEVTLMMIKDIGDNTFGLLTADSVEFPGGQVGSPGVNIIRNFTLAGTGTGTRCFFALSVKGTFTNSTGNFSFRADSPQDFIGPFNVPPGMSSPITQVGIAVIIISAICVGAGVYGVKKAKAPAPRRKGLLDE